MAKTKVHGEYLKDSVVRFTAKAGENITKGQAVYISGISGEVPVVSLADANDTAKMPAFGLAEATVSTNAEVEITSFGTLKGLDTSSFSLGDILYVDTTAGSLTNNPSGLEATKLQNIGMVQRVHATSGSIKVGGAGRTNAVPNLDDGDIFIGDSNNKAISSPLSTEIESYLDGGTSTPILTSLTVASDTDVTVDIGRAKIGNVGFSDFAGFAHRDNATTTNYALLQYNTGETYLNAASGRDINFRINNSNVGVFKSSGNFGIGNSSPTRNLTVGDTDASSVINIKSSATNGYSILALGDSGDDNYAQMFLDNATNKLQIQNGGGGALGNRGITLDSSENVGIGTTATDSYSLGSTGKTLSINSSNAGTGSLISMESADAKRGYLFANASNVVLSAVHTDIPLIFNTNDTERMRLDASGRLLVGTTSSTPAFGTGTGIAFVPTGESMLSANNVTTLFLNRITSDGTILDFRKNGTQVGSIGNISSRIYIGSGDTGIYFDSIRNQIQPNNPSTGSNIDATISLGRDVFRFKDLYLSGGAYIGGTGSANKLDDYEEGTWTPTLDNSGSPTYQVQSGWYTKIGNLVNFSCMIDVNAGISGSSSVKVSGLPFTIRSESNQNFPSFPTFIERGVNGSSATQGYMTLGQAGNSAMEVWEQFNSTSINYNNLTYAEVTSNYFRIRITGTYLT